MGTTNSTPGQTYIKVTNNSKSVFIELTEPGMIRVLVSSFVPPDDNVGTYHLMRYPAGNFSYTGTEDVYVRNDASSGNVKIVVTEVL